MAGDILLPQVAGDPSSQPNKGIGGNKRRIEQTATNQADTSNIKATGVAGAGRKLLRCGIANLNP
jgi:hypothetical protein